MVRNGTLLRVAIVSRATMRRKDAIEKRLVQGGRKMFLRVLCCTVFWEDLYEGEW